jgi:hypothetical protein
MNILPPTSQTKVGVGKIDGNREVGNIQTMFTTLWILTTIFMSVYSQN